MSEQELPPVGSEAPLLPPLHSLPSYREPTPETHRRVSRETEAELALKNSVFTPNIAALLTLFFLATISAVPSLQFVSELRASHSLSQMPTIMAFRSLLPRRGRIDGIPELWPALPKPDEIKSVQKTLERNSVVAQWLLPRIESVLTGILHAGNEQAYLGQGDWLFYLPDVDYVIGPPFCDPFWIKRRTLSAGVQPDAVRAIVDFRDQLAQRGIDLIVMPTPVKPTVAGTHLAYGSRASLFENDSFKKFKASLEDAGVRIFDAESVFNQPAMAAARSPYLKADTHWRPETMEAVAREVAKQIGASPGRSGFELTERKVRALGDIARMLKLPSTQLARYDEEVTIHPVRAGNTTWQASKNADVLLLGDSFSNVFSLAALGWGESAGLAEHLSYEIGRPIDCILQNSDGAFATREILSRDLARGRDRLAGKTIVVWQFAARELAFGDWKLLKLTLGQAQPSTFFVPQPGEKLNITGTVESISRIPIPGSVPYADHIMSVHLVDVAGVSKTECLAYMWSMRGNVWTKAAALRIGDRIEMTVRPWSDLSADLEKINRSEIEDPAVQLQEPCWGELVK